MTEGTVFRPGFVGQLKGRWSYDLAERVTAMAWREDGAVLAVACADGDVVQLEASGGTRFGERREHRGGALRLAWWGGALVSGGIDGVVWIGERSVRVGGWVADLAVRPSGSASPGGASLAVAHGRSVTMLDGAGRVCMSVTAAESTVTSLAWHWSAAAVAAASNGTVHWLSPDGATLSVLQPLWGGNITSLRTLPSRGLVVAGTRGALTYLWVDVDPVSAPAPASQVFALVGENGSGELVGANTEETMLVIAAKELSVLYDVSQPLTPHGPGGVALEVLGEPTALAWHPGGAIVALGIGVDGGGGVAFWDPAHSFRAIAAGDAGSEAVALGWSPDGTSLAIGLADGRLALCAWG